MSLQCRRPGFYPWIGTIPSRREGYPLQYSGLENSVDCIVHGVAKSRTQLSNFHLLTYVYIYKPLSAHLTVNSLKEFPGSSMIRTLDFTARAWIQSLVQELRSLQPMWGTNKQNKKTNQTKQNKTKNCKLLEGRILFIF